MISTKQTSALKKVLIIKHPAFRKEINLLTNLLGLGGKLTHTMLPNKLLYPIVLSKYYFVAHLIIRCERIGSKDADSQATF